MAAAVGVVVIKGARYLTLDGAPISANDVENGTEPTGKPPDLAEVAKCKAFISEFSEPTKTIRRGSSSYGLKHQIDWIGRGYASLNTYIGPRSPPRRCLESGGVGGVRRGSAPAWPMTNHI